MVDAGFVERGELLKQESIDKLDVLGEAEVGAQGAKPPEALGF